MDFGQRLYFNARVLHFQGQTPRVSDAFLVWKGIISAVGTYNDLIQMYPKAKKINLKMQIVIPGFNDAHIHLTAQLLEKYHIDAEKHGPDIQKLILKQHAKTHKTVIVTNYNYDKHNELYNVQAPVLLISPCWHQAYCNNLFRQMHKNICMEPVSFNLHRLTQRQVVQAYNVAFPVKFSTKDLASGIKNIFKKLYAMGITSVQSDDLGYLFPALPQCKTRADVAQQLILALQKAKCYLSLTEQWNIHTKQEMMDFLQEFQGNYFRSEQLKEFNFSQPITKKIIKSQQNMIRTLPVLGPCKIILDGSLGSSTAAITSPYISKEQYQSHYSIVPNIQNNLINNFNKKEMIKKYIYPIQNRAINLSRRRFFINKHYKTNKQRKQSILISLRRKNNRIFYQNTQQQSTTISDKCLSTKADSLDSQNAHELFNLISSGKQDIQQLQLSSCEEQTNINCSQIYKDFCVPDKDQSQLHSQHTHSLTLQHTINCNYGLSKSINEDKQSQNNQKLQPLFYTAMDIATIQSQFQEPCEITQQIDGSPASQLYALTNSSIQLQKDITQDFTQPTIEGNEAQSGEIVQQKIYAPINELKNSINKKTSRELISNTSQSIMNSQICQNIKQYASNHTTHLSQFVTQCKLQNNPLFNIPEYINEHKDVINDYSLYKTIYQKHLQHQGDRHAKNIKQTLQLTQHNYGILNFTCSDLREMSSLCNQKGINIVAHAIGDRAILQAFWTLGKSTSLIHVQIPGIANPLMSKYPYMSIIQPAFIEYDKQLVNKLPLLLKSSLYPLSSIKRIAFSSDAPIGTFDPCLIIKNAVQSHQRKNERLNVLQSIYAYTVGSAITERSNYIKGNIAPGMIADFIVLGHDGIHTFKQGKKVYTGKYQGDILAYQWLLRQLSIDIHPPSIQ